MMTTKVVELYEKVEHFTQVTREDYVKMTDGGVRLLFSVKTTVGTFWFEDGTDEANIEHYMISYYPAWLQPDEMEKGGVVYTTDLECFYFLVALWIVKGGPSNTIEYLTEWLLALVAE